MSLILARPPEQAYVRPSEGAGTTTLTSADNKWQIFNLSANRICVLPSADIKAGEVVRVENRSAFALTIQSSGLNAVDLVSHGMSEMLALVDSPSSAAHWLTVSQVASGTYTPTMTSVSNTDSTTAYVTKFVRVGQVVTITGRFDHDQTAGGTSTFRMSLPIASDFALATDADGLVTGGGLTMGGQYISADTTNNQIQVVIVNGGGPVNQAYSFTCQYLIK